VLRGVVYMTTSSGPRTEPWGTPQEDVCQEDKSVTHLTRKGRDDRYNLNQLRTEPWMYVVSETTQSIRDESVPIQLAQCRFPGMAISDVKI